MADDTVKTVQLNHIAQIAITVSDLARSKAFYKDQLGIPFLFDAGSMAFFLCGSTRLMLGTAEPGKPISSSGTILYFKVDDIEATHDGLLALNVPILQPPHLVAKMPTHDLWMAFVTDPDGNPIGLMSEVPRTDE